MSKKKLLFFIRVFLFSIIFILSLSFFYRFNNFFEETIGILVILGGVLLFRKGLWFGLLFGVIYFGSFLFWNVNYLFMLGVCLVLGVLVLNFFNVNLKVSSKVYSLIPIFLFLHVVWWNYLPLGFYADYVLDVGSDDDLSGNLYLVENEFLGSRECVGEDCFREINGSVEIMFNPDIVLSNDTLISVEVDLNASEDVFLQVDEDLYPLYLKELDGVEPIFVFEDVEVYGPDNNSFIWDLVHNESNDFSVPKYYFLPIDEDSVLFELDFTKPIENRTDISLGGGNLSRAPRFIGEGYEFDGVDDFIEVPNTYDMFENESFIVEVEFEPYNVSQYFAGVVGHFNWEIFIDRNKTRTFLGRMNNKTGEFYNDDFNLKSGQNKITFMYDKGNKKLSLNNNKLKTSSDLKEDIIYNDYNKGNNLKIGKTIHNYDKGDYFNGKISKVKILGLNDTNKYIIFDRGKNIKISSNKIKLLTSDKIQVNSINIIITNE